MLIITLDSNFVLPQSFGRSNVDKKNDKFEFIDIKNIKTAYFQNYYEFYKVKS